MTFFSRPTSLTKSHLSRTIVDDGMSRNASFTGKNNGMWWFESGMLIYTMWPNKMSQILFGVVVVVRATTKDNGCHNHIRQTKQPTQRVLTQTHLTKASTS